VLDDDGKAEAERAAEFLKDKGIQRIVTSTLKRHGQTAEILSQTLGVPVETDEGFRTLNVGEFTGKPRKEHSSELQKYLDSPDEKIPGGESVSGFSARSNTAFANVRKNDAAALVITSRSNIFALLGKPTDEKVKVAKPGGVYTLDGKGLNQVFGGANTDTLAGS